MRPAPGPCAINTLNSTPGASSKGRHGIADESRTWMSEDVIARQDTHHHEHGKERGCFAGEPLATSGTLRRMYIVTRAVPEARDISAHFREDDDDR